MRPEEEEPMPRVAKSYQTVLRSLVGSEKWNRVSFDAQSMYVRLLLSVDDCGRFYGSTGRLLGLLFSAMLDNPSPPTSNQVRAWLGELEAVRLARVYSVGGELYLELLEFYTYQRKDREPKPRFPEPQGTLAPNGCQLSTDGGQRPPSRVFGDGDGDGVPDGDADGDARPTAAKPPTWETVVEELGLEGRGFDESCREWADYRRERRLGQWAPVTWRSNLKHYAEDPEGFAAAVAYTVRMGWQGLRDPDPPRGQAGDGMDGVRSMLEKLA